MNSDAFSHGQIQSKIWLCNELEKFIHANLKIANLGSWYNLVAFMLLTRNAGRYQHILGIDIDPAAKEIADQITEAWRIGKDYKVENIIADANLVNLAGYDLVINCSPEHMESNDWFDNLEYGTMVCIQSSDVETNDDDVWKCVNPNKSLEDLAIKYPLSKYLYSGEKEIRYTVDNGYKRFMLIGIK
jgi:hypothetical protein